jgi:hypothetical protein
MIISEREALMDEERFSRQVVEVIAKRAANICSNPDCGAITTGPAEEMDRSIVIGEAAHIYGARFGSARYSEAMSPAERGDTINAIWLCRNCHKSIDADPNKFPADLLFEWRRQHEEEISKKLGKTGGLLREKIIARQLSEFSACSYLAQQVVIDKPDYWEYKLTIELMRTKLGPVLRRWHALENGLYVRPSILVPLDEVSIWFQTRFTEMMNIAGALSGLANGELQRAWGPPGVAGNASDILFVCDLFTECVQSALVWTEMVRFSRLPDECRVAQALLPAGSKCLVEEIERIPLELAKIFAAEKPSGVQKIHLEPKLPDGWDEQFSVAIEAALDQLAERL